MVGLEDLVRADLERAQRLMRKTGAELDPQFRIASPEGDWWLGLTLSSNFDERKRQLGLVARFMAWKSCPAFTQAVELVKLDAVCCIGVTHKEALGLISRMERNPLRFSEPVEVGVEHIGREIVALLPRGSVTLSDDDIEELRNYFGEHGRFPVVHIPTGRIGV